MFGTDLTRRVTVDINEPLPQLGQGAALRLNAMGNDSHVAGRDVARYEPVRACAEPGARARHADPADLQLSASFGIRRSGLWPALDQLGARRQPDRLGAAGAAVTDRQTITTGSGKATTCAPMSMWRPLKIEHDINNAVTISDQLRYAQLSARQFGITEPQLYTAASANGNGIRGTPALIAPGTPLTSLIVSRNQLAGNSIETYLVNQLDLTRAVPHGFRGSHRCAPASRCRAKPPIRPGFSTIAPFSQTPLLFPNPEPILTTPSPTCPRAPKRPRIRRPSTALDTIKLDEQWELMAGFASTASTPASTRSPSPTRLPARAPAAPTSTRSIRCRAGAARSSTSRCQRQRLLRRRHLVQPVGRGAVAIAANPRPCRRRRANLRGRHQMGSARRQADPARRAVPTEKINVREPDPNNPLFNILAGSGIAEGGEIGVCRHLTPEWQVLAGYGYTYTQSPRSPERGRQAISAAALPTRRQHTANLWTTYELPWWKLQIGGGLNFVSSRFAASVPDQRRRRRAS